LLAAFAVSALLAGGASAGTYSVYSCAGPSGQSVPNLVWTQRRSVPSHTSAVTFGSSCPDLSVTATAGTALAAGEDAGYAFDAPAGTTISGYLIHRSVAVTYPASGTKPTLSAGLRRTVGSETYWGECEAVVANCSIAASGTQSVGLSATSLQLGVECAQTGSSCAGAGISTLKATLIDSRVDLTDNNAPTLSATGGNLAGATSGTRTLDVAINDIGGGVKSYWLEIDGVKTGVTNLGGSCAGFFTQAVPCPSQQASSYTIDLSKYSPGPHTAVATATDAAGNVGTLAPVTFNVGGIATGPGSTGGPSFQANGTPAVTAPLIATSRKVVEGKGGRAVSLRGVLKTSTGAPIVGALLDVTATGIAGVSGTASLGTTKTAKDGSFTFKVKPKGARNITFSFRPASTSASTASASTVVREKLGLSAKRSKARLIRGQELTISGRLTGAAAAAASANVEIDVLNGKKWQKIDVVSTGKGGAYKWKHRFTRVTRPTLFTFRAVVKPSGSWPWKSKTSSSVKVLVLG
jgi:hypothetical protein